MVDKKIAIKTNANLSDETIIEIDNSIDDLVKKFSRNTEQMNLMALEAISLATSVKARSKGLEEQGFLGGILGSITGKNQKVSARNIIDLAETQYIGQQTLNKLAENDLMTYEMVVTLGDKVNRVISDANTVKQDFLELNQQLALFFESMRNNLEARFGALEKTVALLHWKEIIEFQPVYKDKPYPELTRPEKIICLASDFFTLTAQKWKPKDLPFLKSVIVAIGNHPTEKVTLKEVFSAYQEDPGLLCKLLGSKEKIEPLDTLEISPTLLTFKRLDDFKGSDKHVVDTVLEITDGHTVDSISLELVNRFLINELGQDVNKECDFYDVVMNFIEDLMCYRNLQSFYRSSYEVEILDKLYKVKDQKQFDKVITSKEKGKVLLDGDEFTLDLNFPINMEISELRGVGRTKLHLVGSPSESIIYHDDTEKVVRREAMPELFLKFNNLFLTASEPTDLLFLNNDFFEMFKGDDLEIDETIITVICQKERYTAEAKRLKKELSDKTKREQKALNEIKSWLAE